MMEQVQLKDFLIGHNWDKFEEYRTGRSRGLKTGFKTMDVYLGGLPSFVTIQGEPKSCKSTVAMQIFLRHAQKGKPVILVDREIGIHSTRMRMCCHLSGLSILAIKSNNLTREEQKRYEKASEELKALPIYYATDISTTEQLDALVSRVLHKFNKHLLLVIDSVQSLVQDFKDRRSSVDYWVYYFNELKMKHEGNITILMTSEKNRASYGVGAKSGAKESGSVEYKSELVLDLYPNKANTHVTVEAVYQRDGDIGVVTRLEKVKPFSYRLQDEERMPE